VEAKALEIAAARSLVAKALALSVDRIGAETKMYDIGIWDSLGQLSVILAIEEKMHVRITDESAFQSLTSVPGIAAYLAKAAGESA
jgi:acyl carrier protein